MDVNVTVGFGSMLFLEILTGKIMTGQLVITIVVSFQDTKAKAILRTYQIQKVTMVYTHRLNGIKVYTIEEHKTKQRQEKIVKNGQKLHLMTQVLKSKQFFQEMKRDWEIITIAEIQMVNQLFGVTPPIPV